MRVPMSSERFHLPLHPFVRTYFVHISLGSFHWLSWWYVAACTPLRGRPQKSTGTRSCSPTHKTDCMYRNFINASNNIYIVNKRSINTCHSKREPRSSTCFCPPALLPCRELM